MSRITFLDNAAEGKNNWWRYIITIILTWFTLYIFLILFLIYTRNAYYLVSILSDPLQSIEFLGLSSIVSILFLYIGVRFINERKFMSIVNTNSNFSWRRVLKGAGIWFGLLTLGLVISLILNPTNLNVTFNPQTFLIWLIISLAVFPIQASFEELFFRGYLMQAIGRIRIKRLHVGLLAKKPVIPLITTSIIFALLHYTNGSNTMSSVDIVLQVFIIGLTLGIITLGENRLETAMGVHIANNIFVALIINSSSGGFGNVPSLLTDTSTPNLLLDFPIFVLYALLLLLIIFWGKKENIIRIFKS
jgi:membrane protease YdiL (CAAX protease family)